MLATRMVSAPMQASCTTSSTTTESQTPSKSILVRTRVPWQIDFRTTFCRSLQRTSASTKHANKHSSNTHIGECMRSRTKQILKCITVCIGAFAVGSAQQGAVAQEPASLPYMNSQLSAEQRAADLVRRM